MSKDSRAFAYLEQAYNRFQSVEEVGSADAVANVYRTLSGGCYPTAHHWPISGPWCYCGRKKWRNE